MEMRTWTPGDSFVLPPLDDSCYAPHAVPLPEPNYPSHAARPGGCPCWKCHIVAGVDVWWMVVCAKCGNKRCPHATDHRHDCTGSNESGQTGSNYGI